MRKLFQKLGLIKKKPGLILNQIAPTDLGLEIVTKGGLSLWHIHFFEEISWDKGRFGSSVVNPDPDPGTSVAFPRITYKYLMRCKCGAEGIKSLRALI